MDIIYTCDSCNCSTHYKVGEGGFETAQFAYSYGSILGWIDMQDEEVPDITRLCPTCNPRCKHRSWQPILPGFIQIIKEFKRHENNSRATKDR